MIKRFDMARHITMCLALALLSLCSLAEPVTYSEHQARKNRPITLDEAIKEAMANNLALQKAKARVDQRRGQARHASRLVPDNPTLSAQTAKRDTATGQSTDWGVRLTQSFWIAGQGGLRSDAADARVTAASQQWRYLQTAIAARTRRAFFNVLWAQRGVATAEQLVAANRKLDTYAEKRLVAGKANALEANTAAIGLSRARSELAQARNTLERARLQLAGLLARKSVATLEVEGKLKPWALALPDRDQLVAMAVERRGDLNAAAKAVDAARRELSLSRRSVIPNLTVFGFYKEEENAEVTGAGVSLPLPLLHGYGGERDAASARLRQRQIEADELALSVRREVGLALADYRAAARRASLLGTKTLNRAAENVALTQKALAAGEAGSPAVTAAQSQLLSVRRNYLQILQQLIKAVTELERATGGLVAVSANNKSETNQGQGEADNEDF